MAAYRNGLLTVSYAFLKSRKATAAVCGAVMLPVGPQLLGQQLQEVDVVSDEAPWQEGGLFGAHRCRQDGGQPYGQGFCHEPVVRVQQRDGPVVGGGGRIPRLEEGVELIEPEPLRNRPRAPHCRKDRCQQEGQL